MERLPKRRQKYLDQREGDELEAVLGRLHKCISLAKECITLEKNTSIAREQIEDTVFHLNEQRDPLQKKLSNIEWKQSYEGIQELFSYLEKTLKSGAANFSSSELENVRTYCEALRLISRPIESKEDIRISPKQPIIQMLYSTNFGWLGQLERQYNYIRDNASINLKEVNELLATVEKRLTQEENIPNLLSLSVLQYINAIRQLAQKRCELEGFIPTLLEAISSAKKDILEESELE